MNELDYKIKKILTEDTYMPNSYKNMVRTALFMKREKKKKKQFKAIPIFAMGVILTTGVCLATSYTIKNFLYNNKGMDTAIENGYIFNNESEYIIANDIGIKVEKMLMDDYNLNISFLVNLDNKIKNIDRIEFMDMIITDNDKKILYCEDEMTFKNYCTINNIEQVWKETNSNYINSGSNYYIKKIEGNNLNVIYNFYADMFPKSKVLNIEMHKIKIIAENEKIIEGDWKIEVSIPAMFYNRENYVYQVEKCTNKDFEVKEVLVYNTGTKIEIVTEESPDLPYDINDDDETKERKIKEMYEKIQNMTVEEYKKQLENSKFKNEYIENENGTKFYPSQSTESDGGYSNTDMKYLNYWQTFNMTKYDATDKLKIYLNYKGEDVYIELKRKQT